MSDQDARAFLAEALDFFNDHPSFSLRRDRRRTSYELAARIDAFLTVGAPHVPAVAVARERWAAADFLWIDPDERTVQRNEDGYWVRAWVRVGHASVGEISTAHADRYRDAVAVLPDDTCAIFLVHLRDGESYRTIADRLGITTRVVGQHIAAALHAIGHALDAE